MRRTATVLALAALLATAGCDRRSDRLGAGEDVGFCRAWVEWEELEEPVVTDREEVVRWSEGALRILDRVDLRYEIDEKRPPASVRASLRTVARELRGYRDRVRAATDDDGLRRAAAVLSSGPFDREVDTLTDIGAGDCTPEERRG